MENKKLSQEELQKLAELQENNRAIVREFGEIALIRLSIEEREANAKTYLSELRKTEQEFGKELSDKYGNGSIDLNAGEFIPAPEQPAEESAE